MEDKLLTISIAAYNVQDYLAKAIKSCIVQEDLRSYLEIIVVNDGSKDNTLEIAQQYQHTYPGMIHIINKSNAGHGSTINSSLSIAAGKYFKLLDGDDWFDTNELEKLLVGLKNCNEDLLLTNHVKVTEKDEILETVKYGSANEGVPYTLTESSSINWHMHNITIKTSLLKNNNVIISENRFYVDTEYVANVMRLVNTYMCLDYTVYHYRIDRIGQSISRRGMVAHREDAKAIFFVLLNMLNQMDNNMRKAMLENYVVQYAKFALESYLLCPCTKQAKQSVREFDLSIKQSNFNIFKSVGDNRGIALLRFFHYKLYFISHINAMRCHK